MKKTIMVFGSTSFLGSNLIAYLRNDFRIIGTYNKFRTEIPGINFFPLDVLKKEEVSKLIAFCRPDVTIYASGMHSIRECHLKPKYADGLNTAGAANVCAASERYGARFILLSSAYVMAGENLLYREGDMPMPNTAYGSSLSSAEFYVQRSCLNYLILRCSELYGRGLNPLKPNLFETITEKLLLKEVVLADDVVHTGFLDVEILAKIIKATIDEDIRNRLFQVSSSDFMTRYQFAIEAAKTLGCDTSLVQRSNFNFPIEHAGQKEVSNFYFKMDSSNLEGFLGAKMPSINESLTITSKRLSQA